MGHSNSNRTVSLSAMLDALDRIERLNQEKRSLLEKKNTQEWSKYEAKITGCMGSAPTSRRR